ncbi:MAG: right-handed parallel beta-helix repeat-containing protein [Desulfobacterales bacterium]|nr:right-handed parallel beta-helix repeat-containing protein [Desulfobacterales bacterium]
MKKRLRVLFAFCLFAAFAWADASAAVYHVRPDGGDNRQCDGKADAAYPGDGENQSCAWDHPFRALPPYGSPRISGGDDLFIANGAYMMGCGAPGADGCDLSEAWDCHMPAIPSGPDSLHPTRILGEGWDVGCADPPEFYGVERANLILNLDGSDNVEIACLEITDHSPCVEFHTGGLACNRDAPPHGPWAVNGLYARDSSRVTLRHLNIHGLAGAGVLAGRLGDWTVENVRIAANGWVGWDGDIEGDDSNTGAMIFRGWTVEWNGCGETWPGEEPAGCWAQTAGGYGDGVGTGSTAGDWIIEDSRFLHNTSDGLDLLYHDLGGSITLNRVRAEGNAGNQIKLTGRATINNSVLVGNCAYFEGRAFTHHVDPCRALGNMLEVVYRGGESVVLENSTLYGHGDGLVCGGPREGFQCDGTETLAARNNIFLGDVDFNGDGSDITFLFYQENCRDLKLDSDFNVMHNTKNVACGADGDAVLSGANDICADPELSGPLSGDVYDMTPTPGSPAVDAGSPEHGPAGDISGASRPMGAGFDMGAHEYTNAQRGPVPDITVNGSNGPVTLSEDTPVSAAIRLDPGDMAGRSADLWVGVYTLFDPPLDWFTLVDETGWREGITPYGQEAITAMSPTSIYKGSLPPGDYYFFFAADGVMDGCPAADWLDYVHVNVAPGTESNPR